MTKASITIETNPSTRDLVKRVLSAKDGVKTDRRNMLRSQMRRLTDLTQQEAPKNTGLFAQNISFKTFESGDNLEGRVYLPQPLGKWIIEGTQPHTIPSGGSAAQLAKGYPLRFYWKKAGGVVAFWSVNHPGTKANKFTGRAYRRWLPGARADMRLLGENFTRRLAGGTVTVKTL